MDILSDLSAIAAAKYGLQLKDPIFRAFDKLVQDPRFELHNTYIEDDYGEFNSKLIDFYDVNQTTKTLRDILDMVCILNGHFAKPTSRPVYEPKETIYYWIEMLTKELVNSGTGNDFDGIPEKGSGIVNGIKIRASIYHILDILN